MEMFKTHKTSSIEFVAVVVIILVLGFKSKAQNPNSINTIDYSNWNDLLQKHVSENGEVDYTGFIKDKDKLLTFTKKLSDHSPKKGWSKNEKKAYLINAYNAFTIQLIIDNYPVKSIKHIGKEPFDAFKKKFISFDGRMVSLDDIEKGMLVKMGDPRVHFAVNCASFSCPKLKNEAYKAGLLNTQLNKAASEFINSDLNQITKSDVKLSQIFKWYKSDFETESQSLIEFINQYSTEKISPNTEIKYLAYSWDLNSL